MKLASLLVVLGLMHTALASEWRLTSVSQPLYLHGSDTDPVITITAVPYATFSADPEWRFYAISVPFIPPTDRAEPVHDVNLASLYRLSVSGTYREDGKNVLVTIDATKAVQPEDYPFTVEQVIDAVTTCVKMMFPPRPPVGGKLDIVVKRTRGSADR